MGNTPKWRIKAELVAVYKQTINICTLSNERIFIIINNKLKTTYRTLSHFAVLPTPFRHRVDVDVVVPRATREELSICTLYVNSLVHIMN